MAKEELKAIRKEFLDKMETRLRESSEPEDDLFYCHPNEDHIVLSHALFWMMIPLMAFNRYGKVVCPEIERMLLRLNRMVEEQMNLW